MRKITMSSLVILLTILSACGNFNNKGTSVKNKMPDKKVVEIATKAYAFGYPMILMNYTEKISTNVVKPTSVYAPVNQIGHFREFPNDKFTAVVKPNVDTYYSIAWFDLKAQPVVLTVPATKRYYLLPLYDAYSNVFFVPGPRTTGTGAHTFLLTGPFWKGKVPKGMTQVKAPSNTVWMIGRTQVNSLKDGAKVVAAFQNGIKIDLLSDYGKNIKPAKGKVVDAYKKIVPVENTRALAIEEYFNKLVQLMVNNPPAKADSVIVKQMRSIGIVAGQKFSMAGFSPELRKKLDSIPAQEHQKWVNISTGKIDIGLTNVNGWLLLAKGMGSYGTNYSFRAFIAFIGLGANLSADAVYPITSVDSKGNPIVGQNKYILHFNKGETPPVNAFWSLTAYNSKDLLIPNSINRFALGDRDNLHYNKDGSLDIYIQNSNPGGAKTSNWLPSTKEGLTNLTLRLYWPKESILNGTWKVPAVERVQ